MARIFLRSSIIAAAFTLCACSEYENMQQTGFEGSTVQESSPSDVQPGSIIVKFKTEPAVTKSSGPLFDNLNVTECTRLFPDCGKFEKRTREEGLHLWYIISFDPSLPLTKVQSDILSSDNVECVEFVHPVKAADVSFPFNDPRLSEQWHYYNAGDRDGMKKGSDINLLDAWNMETGRPDVIVAVIDEGVDYDHEDLHRNMWVNETEFNGVQGVDDDGNGYVDDIYGYNFTVYNDGSGYVMRGELDPCNHGTHVAGTIAAVNGNGTGVCGIAGGTASSRGASLMSCQIMDEKNSPAYPQRAIKYAADNGAVIAQNSWSGTDEQSTHQAINYFIKYAGIDGEGTQNGPMAGGIFIVAAGNENKSTDAYPAMYDETYSVAAIGADYEKAYYSNYGSWVDIAAPGGDAQKGFYVLSTVKNDSYDNYQGTSMACPHVSGVAALLVSKFGGSGFTNTMLADILSSSANHDSLYKYNPDYAGCLGAGLLDAGSALSVYGPEPPDKVDFIWASSDANTIHLKWRIPSDSDSGKPSYFTLYLSDRDLSAFEPGEVIPDHIQTRRIPVGTGGVGDTVYVDISDLEFRTMYHFRVDTWDNNGSHSGLSDQFTCMTQANTPPVITPLDPTVMTLKKHQTAQCRFAVSDPDGHDVSYSVDGGSSAVRSSYENDIVTVRINGLNADAGSYNGVLTVSDSYDETSSYFSYTILPNHSPKVISLPENVLFSSKAASTEYDLSKYITDEDGEELVFSAVHSSAQNLIELSIDGSILTIQSNWYGQTTVTATGTDASGASCSMDFEVLVRDGSQLYDYYPSPVTDVLHVRAGRTTTGNIQLYNESGAMIYSSQESFDPFSPASIDMSAMPGGIYVLKVGVGSDVSESKVIKL